jgi:nitroreductase
MPQDAKPSDTGRIGLTVEDAITGRQSVRAFLRKPVPSDVIERILAIAGRAPSGSNIQPWRVWVVSDPALKALAAELAALFDAGVEEKRAYEYYPVNWYEPYIGRRRSCGFGLYNSVGIPRGDKAGMHAQRRQNYLFFGAPVCLFFSIDKKLELGSWLDYGMFLQSIMIAARDFGLESVPQAAVANYPDVVMRRLGIPDTQTLICGISLGYPDRAAKVNSFRTERAPIADFTTWIDALKP